MAKASLELKGIRLPLPPECSDSRQVLSHPVLHSASQTQGSKHARPVLSQLSDISSLMGGGVCLFVLFFEVLICLFF